MRPLGMLRQIDLETLSTPAKNHFVLADRQRLNQILLNFVSNAIKYNRQGGRVTVWWEERENARLRINVTDTGTGVPPEKIERLFTPFERLGAEHTGIEGTGLGLALSRGLAEAMDGGVGVESEVGRGSTFWVDLSGADPVPREPKSAGLPAAKAAAAISGTVLYIEDNVSNVRLVERLLKQRRPGITLLNATDGELGVSMALTHQPDLIFLDLHLPDTSGEDVLRRLWEDTRTRAIPVAVLSADATVHQNRRLITAGATAYLTKPLDVTQLLNLIDERFR